jgi:hypothetical protein
MERPLMKKKSFRRFEVLLPARFNDGQDVPDELLGQAATEVMQRFGAVTFFQEAAEGYWRHEGKVFQDSLGLLVVDVPDTAANRKWMKAFKARWKGRLEQLEIWMVSYRIDIE